MWPFGESKEVSKDKAKKAREDYEEYRKACSDVLTVSARDYCDSASKSLKDYSMISVQSRDSFIQEQALLELYRRGNKIGAEKIVDVRLSSRGQGIGSEIYLIGTALVPRKKW